MKEAARQARAESRIIAFVPTMGALHAGHTALVQRAKQECAPVIASIFVNPKQFGPNEDFAKYPRTLEADSEKFSAAGADALFLPEAAEIYQRVRSKHDHATVVFIPTPYPIEDQRWDFSIPRNEQSGIFIGTREWDVPSRNHFATLLVARELCEATSEPVTAVNLDGYKGRRLLGELNFPEGKLRLIEKWKTYPDYLRDVARHKIVLQLDRSHVPGQVAGDALLCRIPCVGGDGAIERIAFSKMCGEGRTIIEVASMALDLLKNPELREVVVAESQERARERLSFEPVRTQLAKFFANVQGTSAFDP